MKQFVSQDPRSYSSYFDLKIRFRARKVTGIFEKRATGPVKRAPCTDFVAKSRTTPYFLQQIFAACKRMICCMKQQQHDINFSMLLVGSCVPVITWLCSRVMRFQSRPTNWPLLTIESPVAQVVRASD